MSSLDVRAIDEADLKKEKAPAVKTEYRVFLSEEAFDRAVERGTADTTREIGGVLVGNVYKDDAGPYLKIDTTIDALHADEKGAELTFTHDTWDHINKEMDTKHKDKKVVGWYHTHPGFSVFLSDRDQFIQKSFFNLPFQVAFVYDPKSKEHGMFTWHDNEVRRSRRYWVGAKEQIWDANRASGAPEKKDVERKDEPAKSAEEPLFGEGSGGFIATVVLGLMLFLIGGFLGKCYGEQKVQEVAVAANEKIRDAKVAGQELTLASLQNDLVSLLRQTMGDEALHKPVNDELTKLDALLKDLDAPPQAGVDQTKRLKDTIAQLRQDLVALAQRSQLRAGRSREHRGEDATGPDVQGRARARRRAASRRDRPSVFGARERRGKDRQGAREAPVADRSQDRSGQPQPVSNAAAELRQVGNASGRWWSCTAARPRADGPATCALTGPG